MFTENKQGFTLLEVMLVLAVLAVILSVTSFGFRSWLDYYRLRAESRQLYFTFLKARQYAIIKQEGYGLAFDPQKGAYTLFSENKGEIQTYLLPSGVYFQEEGIAFGNSQQMTFRPTGTARGGHVILENGSGINYQIVVYGLTGRVRFQR